MLKATRSSVASVSRVDDNEVFGGRNVISWLDVSRKTKSKSWKKSEYLGNNNNLEEFKFLNFKAKKAFNHLKQAFMKAPILQHFDSEYYIQIEINASGYIIRGVLSQLIPNQLRLSQVLIGIQ